jgi:hypothetical protein
MSDVSTSEPETIRTRAPRTSLESDVKRVCDDYITGALVLPDGKLLTPHAIAASVMERRNDDTKVSGGAVAACLARWTEIGYVATNAKPVAFLDYTDAGRNEGLAALKRAHSARLATARAAVRESNKAANGAPGTGGTEAPADAPF